MSHQPSPATPGMVDGLVTSVTVESIEKLFMLNTANMMGELESLEKRIATLDNDSFARLRDWFIEFDQSRWDKKLAADSNAGKLDFLVNAALVEHQAGKTRDL